MMAAKKAPVLLLRASKGEADPYGVAFSHGGYCPYSIPVLQFDFTNERELSTALLDPMRYAGIIFTSQTAVDSAVHALSSTAPDWKKEHTSHKWEDLPVFVVGKATAAAVSRLGLSPAAGSFSGNAETLSQVILEHFPPEVRPSLKPLLFPCSSLRRETLPSRMEEAGINLHSVSCYNTIASPLIAERIKEIKVDSDAFWVVFFSPSGVNFALKHVQSSCKTLKYAAIGPTTAEALREAGVTVDAVSSQPNPNSLLEAISAADTRGLGCS